MGSEHVVIVIAALARSSSSYPATCSRCGRECYVTAGGNVLALDGDPVVCVECLEPHEAGYTAGTIRRG